MYTNNTKTSSPVVPGPSESFLFALCRPKYKSSFKFATAVPIYIYIYIYFELSRKKLFSKTFSHKIHTSCLITSSISYENVNTPSSDTPFPLYVRQTKFLR